MSTIRSQVVKAVFMFLSAISASLTPVRVSLRRVPVETNPLRRIRR
jgi:hypothetical protein